MTDQSATVAYLPDARISRVRENLNAAMHDLAWLATRPGAPSEFALSGMRVDNALDYFDRAVGEEA